MYSFAGGLDFFFAGAEYAAVNVCEMPDHAEIAVQWNARQIRVHQRAEATAAGPVRRARQLDNLDRLLSRCR